RVLLPAAARDNLSQVLEYEIEHLVPLPRDQVYFDYSARALGEERLEVLLMCIPREVVRVHLEALEDAFVRPRGIVLASTAIADGDLLALAAGRLGAPREFFEAREPGLLPAVGAALDAVREGTLPVNLLPAEGRRGAEEGLSLATVVLVAVLGVLLLVWGGSALVKDELNRRHVRDELARVEPLVKEVKALQNESDDLRRQLKILTGEEKRVTVLLKELSDVIPADAYLSSMNLRAGRLTLDGMAHSASDLIAALEKSKRFKNVTFTSPTTRSGDKDRFSLTAEVER